MKKVLIIAAVILSIALLAVSVKKTRTNECPECPKINETCPNGTCPLK